MAPIFFGVAVRENGV